MKIITQNNNTIEFDDIQNIFIEEQSKTKYRMYGMHEGSNKQIDIGIYSTEKKATDEFKRIYDNYIVGTEILDILPA